MDVKLNDIDRRVLGVMMEKEMSQPDYYPMTLNAVVAACNQKQNRDPVMSLDEVAIEAALASLQEMGLLTAMFPAQGGRARRHRHEVEKVFGAPPLLNEEIKAGRIDAVISFWHYVARLEAAGMRRIAGVNEAARELGVESSVPLLGYVFHEAWASAHQAEVLALVRASRKAKEIMRSSDAEWQRLKPLTKAKDEATLAALRDGFRAGIPEKWGEAEQRDARRIFDILSELGGAKLVGSSRELQAGTFWPALIF